MTRAPQRSAVIALALFTSSCGLCSDEVLQQQSSPDSTLIATSLVQECGATTNFSSIVSLHGRASRFDDDAALVFVIEGRHSPVLNWPGDRSLQIRCEDCDQRNIFRQVSILGGVRVQFDLPPVPQPLRQ